jgi:hypothetical protein
MTVPPSVILTWKEPDGMDVSSAFVLIWTLIELP